jgi:DHA1 family tetracycline resistance protein-like MFS transporter
LSNFGLGADYLLMALAPTLGWLFVGRVISGITSASVPTAYAYIADVTPKEKRAKAFGLIGAAFGIGFVLGPAVGGILGEINPRLPFWVAGAFSLANAMYGLFVLPESLPRERRGPFNWRRANPVGALRFLGGHPELRWFAAMDFLYKVAHASLPAVFALYAMHRYGWNTRQVGYMLAGVGIMFAVVQGGLVGPIVGSLGERRTLFLALLSGAAGFAMYGWAPTARLFVIGVPIMGLWGLYGPAVQSLMTRIVQPTEQGLLQGALTSLAGVANIIAPYLFSTIFAAGIDNVGWTLPGAPFLLAAALLVIGLGLGVRATKPLAVPPAAVLPAD